uniref:Uncharacterized protein n=1 Tax=Pithovirus LCPAC304 TaxID=2506594 RepID=A0A481Z874_9VIRU|nr:MAG: hypothetical protein LCPAC304_03200 [Pithovirus LCPAC304]
MYSILIAIVGVIVFELVVLHYVLQCAMKYNGVGEKSTKSRAPHNQVPDWFCKFIRKILDEPTRAHVPIEIEYHKIDASRKTFRTGLIEAKNALNVLIDHRDKAVCKRWKWGIGSRIEGGKLFVWSSPNPRTMRSTIYNVKKMQVTISADYNHVHIHNVEDSETQLIWSSHCMNV